MLRGKVHLAHTKNPSDCEAFNEFHKRERQVLSIAHKLTGAKRSNISVRTLLSIDECERALAGYGVAAPFVSFRGGGTNSTLLATRGAMCSATLAAGITPSLHYELLRSAREQNASNETLDALQTRLDRYLEPNPSWLHFHSYNSTITPTSDLENARSAHKYASWPPVFKPPLELPNASLHFGRVGIGVIGSAYVTRQLKTGGARDDASSTRQKRATRRSRSSSSHVERDRFNRSRRPAGGDDGASKCAQRHQCAIARARANERGTIDRGKRARQGRTTSDQKTSRSLGRRLVSCKRRRRPRRPPRRRQRRRRGRWARPAEAQAKSADLEHSLQQATAREAALKKENETLLAKYMEALQLQAAAMDGEIEQFEKAKAESPRPDVSLHPRPQRPRLLSGPLDALLPQVPHRRQTDGNRLALI